MCENTSPVLAKVPFHFVFSKMNVWKFSPPEWKHLLHREKHMKVAKPNTLFKACTENAALLKLEKKIVIDILYFQMVRKNEGMYLLLKFVNGRRKGGILPTISSYRIKVGTQ